ncbi:hypothetical protein CHS0354_001962 [Potamilus streckersoni]|uniref:ABC transmembrane type-1 domain-containing protein n=1 Tax=Potamilus streckersoni TaxID=2493646 RepID=A0AAE0W8I5_9BIVA|nr:hypothetical protein CHS0354_001962 [Potamilus streckersoni]
MRATSIYLLYSVVLINIIGFLLALLVTRPLKGANLLRASFFIPNMIGGLLLGYIWKFIFLKIFPSMYDFTGLFFFNYPWLSETQLALAGMAIVSTWQMGGYIMIIYIAAIQAIPEEYYEAARIDGASAFQMMKNITLPLVAPAITISLFLTVSQGFKMFDVNVSLTNGDPARTTELLALNIYQTAFTNSEFSYAQSLSLMFMLLIAVVTLTQVYISKKRELEY